MKKYHYSGKNNKKIIDLIEEKSSGGSQLVIGNKSYDKKLFKYIGEKKKIKIENGEQSFEFVFALLGSDSV